MLCQQKAVHIIIKNKKISYHKKYRLLQKEWFVKSFGSQHIFYSCV